MRGGAGLVWSLCIVIGVRLCVGLKNNICRHVNHVIVHRNKHRWVVLLLSIHPSINRGQYVVLMPEECQDRNHNCRVVPLFSAVVCANKFRGLKYCFISQDEAISLVPCWKSPRCTYWQKLIHCSPAAVYALQICSLPLTVCTRRCIVFCNPIEAPFLDRLAMLPPLKPGA